MEKSGVVAAALQNASAGWEFIELKQIKVNERFDFTF
jgi:hypothetical protein